MRSLTNVKHSAEGINQALYIESELYLRTHSVRPVSTQVSNAWLHQYTPDDFILRQREIETQNERESTGA